MPSTDEDGEESNLLEEKEGKIEEIFEIDDQLKVVLSKLYNYFIKPFELLLPRKFAIIPHLYSHRIPWNFLLNGTKYLVEEKIILANPSVTSMWLLHKMNQIKKMKIAEKISEKLMSEEITTLIVANPEMPQKLKPLPGSAEEANIVANHFDGKCILLQGAKATKSNILKHIQKSRWIHFATHCLLNNYQDSFSFLESSLAVSKSCDPISGEEIESESYIKANEILDFKELNANCIVFSACNSGEGLVTEEGVLDFSWACMSHGVKNMVVSIYQVPDNLTIKLMRYFYEKLDSKFPSMEIDIPSMEIDIPSMEIDIPEIFHRALKQLIIELKDQKLSDVFALGGFICAGI